MTEYGLDEDRFGGASPVAAEIFAYVRNDSELKSEQWAFHGKSGFVADRSTGAAFSHVSLTGWGEDKVFVTAVQQDDGTWSIGHRIERAK
jgi:hypothetical protein